MTRKWTVLVFGLLLLMLAPACQKLNPPAPTTPQLSKERLIAESAIPLNVGDLVAVTREGGDSGFAELWFVKPDKSIVMVRVNPATGSLRPLALTIPRS